jgi:hypothetical protein
LRSSRSRIPSSRWRTVGLPPADDARFLVVRM